MKQMFAALFVLISSYSFAQDFNLSTLKMGPYSLKMHQSEAEKIANRKLIFPTEQNDYNGESTVYFNGESLKIGLIQNYFEENAKPNTYVIYSISTSSKKFKTQSGIGIGSSRNDLINTYRDFPNFSIYQGWNDEGKDPNLSYFTLDDMDAGTTMIFKMVNKIVVEITISYNEGGC